MKKDNRPLASSTKHRTTLYLVRNQTVQFIGAHVIPNDKNTLDEFDEMFTDWYKDDPSDFICNCKLGKILVIKRIHAEKNKSN